MASKIDTISKRSKLKMKGHGHPVWERISKGKALGYVKLASGGMWRARLVNGKTTTEKVVNGKTKIIEKVIYAYTDLGAPELEEGDGNLSHGDAAEAAGKWFAKVKGTNAQYTLKECIADYIQKVEMDNTPEAAKHTRMRLNKHIPLSTQNKLVSKLTTAEIKKWHRGMVKGENAEEKRKSKDSSNRTLSMLKAALNYAYELDIVGTPVWNKVKPHKGVKRGKKDSADLLTDRQVAALLKATSGGFYNLCKTAALTGARYGELCKANKKDFDPDGHTLTLRTLKGGGGEERIRHAELSDETVEFLKSITSNNKPVIEIKGQRPNAPLLTRDDGERWGKSHQFRPWKNAVRATAKNKHKEDRVPAWAVFYDLRHYFISTALMEGVPINVVAENCGTSIKMIEETYAKASKAFKHDAFNRLGGKLGNA